MVCLFPKFRENPPTTFFSYPVKLTYRHTNSGQNRTPA